MRACMRALTRVCSIASSSPLHHLYMTCSSRDASPTVVLITSSSPLHRLFITSSSPLYDMLLTGCFSYCRQPGMSSASSTTLLARPSPPQLTPAVRSATRTPAVWARANWADRNVAIAAEQSTLRTRPTIHPPRQARGCLITTCRREMAQRSPHTTYSTSAARATASRMPIPLSPLAYLVELRYPVLHTTPTPHPPP